MEKYSIKITINKNKQKITMVTKNLTEAMKWLQIQTPSKGEK